MGLQGLGSDARGNSGSLCCQVFRHMEAGTEGCQARVLIGSHKGILHRPRLLGRVAAFLELLQLNARR